MANDDHVAILKKGVATWNAWRDENPGIRPNLSAADLSDADLSAADLSDADLIEADLSRANLSAADLSDADLSDADLIEADLSRADLSDADLIEAVLINANLIEAKLHRANLSGANLSDADLSEADLSDADLIEADLSGLSGANLSAAKLHRADLQGAILIGADFSGADLTGCRIHGVSAWRLKLDGATKQQNLVITRHNEPAITVDDIEVAQFIYLMLDNQKIRNVIDTITSKAVLILGRFTDERKAVLDALREELRKRNYLPILFDFDVPDTRDITETVSLLARMARFIIADLTDPSSIPKELEAIVPGLAVPVQPLLLEASRPYAMFKDYWKYDWVLPVYQYEGLEPLLATLAEKVIAPAEAKVKALEERRRIIEAELTKPQ
jgi:Pentapeptide repeats (8 copies)